MTRRKQQKNGKRHIFMGKRAGPKKAPVYLSVKKDDFRSPLRMIYISQKYLNKSS